MCPIQSLSSNFVNKVKCPEDKKKIVFWDTTIKGFILEVRSSGNKTYALRWREGSRQNQHRIASHTDLTFEKARRAAEIARGKVVLGKDPAEEKRVKKKVPTLSYFVEFHYLPFIKKDKKSWKADDSMLRCHILPKFGTQHMDKISTQAITNFIHGMSEKGYANGSCNRAIVLMKYLYSAAQKKLNIPGIKSNPAEEIKLLKVEHRERFLTAEETSRLFQAVKKSKNTQLKYIVPLLLYLGSRKNELIQSKWSEFDLERRIWSIPASNSKSGKSRHVPLSKAALEILNQLPRFDGCPYVVPNVETLKPHVQLHKAWDNARIAAGLPDVRMHDLRHSMASNMVNSGRSIYEVAKVLGHSQLKTTQRYAHLSQETLLEAVDAAADATGMNGKQVQI